MEAVPRLPMISFDLKVSPEPTSFGSKLKQYIQDFYHEDATSYLTEIRNLEGLRATAVSPVRGATLASCSTLKRYYCQLHFLQSRFPMSKDGAAAVPFTWRDTYANMVCTLADIRFEMVSILYNIGAVHSYAGASESRETADGMKLACTHFQCAAWAFQHLKDTFPQPSGVDLAPDIMQFMYHLMLAQAQECILEKSMMDNRKATIIEDKRMEENFTFNWKRYVKFKIAYHTCVSLLYQGQQAEEQQKMGERVAFYQAAAEKLEEANKLSKGMDSAEAINEALTFTMDVVEGKKKAAKNENEFIYHEEIPEKDTLPEVKGASLVKGIPFDVNDPEVSGPDIFGRLVPMKAHEASSLYSEEKAKLLRKVGAMIDDKDQSLFTYMTSLQLEHLNLFSEPERLPQELVDRCAALSAKPSAIQDLVDAMGKLADTYQDVESMLQEVKELLEQEEAREKEYQEVMGNRPPSIVATDLTREARKYEEAHAKASESNQTLHKAMTMNISNLRILSLPLDELDSQIPSLKVLDSPADDSSRKEMQHLVNKVEEMKRQRSMLATQLRDSITQDDITRQLVTRTGEPLDTIFSQEMQKHERYVTFIEQNLLAQENILKALTDAYARYAGTRKATNEIIRKRESIINGLISSYDAYEDLLAKSSKGLEFYRKLETNVSKLLQRVKGTCKVQEEEREQILLKNKKSLPRTRKATSNTSSDSESNEPSSSGPKLKDYLQNMKKGGSGGGGGYSAGSQPSNPYFNAAVTNYGHLPSSISPQPSGYYDQSGMVSQLSSDSGSQQWIPSVRPAPVGSEGTGEQTPSVCSSTNMASKQPVVDGKLQPHSHGSYQMPTSDSTGMKAGASYPLSVAYSSYNPAGYGSNTPAYRALQMPLMHPQSAYSQGHFNYSDQYGMQQYSQGQVLPAASESSLPTSGSYYHDPSQSTATSQANYAAYAAPANTQQYNSTYSQQGGAPQYSSGTESYTGQSYSQGYTPVAQGYPTSSTPKGASYPSYPTSTSQTASSYFPTQQSYYPLAATSQDAALYHSTQKLPYSSTFTSQDASSYTATQQSAYPSSSAEQISDNNSSYAYTSPSAMGGSNHVSTQQPGASFSTPSYTEGSTTDTGVSYSQYMPQSQYYPGVQVPKPGLSQTSSYGGHPGYSFNTTSGTYNYGSGYQSSSAEENNYNLGEYQQGNQQASVYSMTGTSSGTNPTKSNYGSEFHGNSAASSNSVTSLSSGSSSEVSLVPQPSYYQYDYPAQPTDVATVLHTSSIAQSTEYLYMNAGTSTSFYTNAGTNSTSQTSSSQVSVDGQTYAAQYNTNQAESYQTPEYIQNQYYTVQYGYQNASGMPNMDTPPQSPHHVIVQQQGNVNSQQQNPQQQSAVNPMTYMQAGDPNSTTTTYSQKGASPYSSSTSAEGAESSTEPSSNLDLLAGLDFSVNQAPLVPQQPAKANLVESPVKQTVVTQAVTAPTSFSPKKSSQNSVSSPKLSPPLEQSTSVTDLKPQETNSSEKHNGDISNLMVSPSDGNKESKLTLKVFGKDLYTDPEALNQFVQEVEKFEKFVEGLTTKTLNGPTPLDMKWKELLDFQEKDAHKHSISVARCYPMKNRFPDILPYDNSRVELPSTKDDYINASFMKDVTPLTPPFIVTQAPLPSTYCDFWTMVWEQQVEVVVCLLSDLELNNQVYWPLEKGQELAMGKMKLSLQSSNVRPHWTERILSICVGETRVSRVIVHLQFTAWPGSSFPASPGPFLSLVCEALTFYCQQRAASHPVVVHCLSGVGRTGLFVLATAAVCEVQAGQGLLDLVPTASTMSASRKNSLRDREHLKFAYQAVLYYAQDLLMKRGILTSRSTFEDKRSRAGKSHTRHPSEDFLLGPPTDLSQLQSGVEKMGLAATNNSDSLTTLPGYRCDSGADSHPAGQLVGSNSGSVSNSRSSTPPFGYLPSLADPSKFSLKTEAAQDKSRKRFTRESFESKRRESTTSLESSQIDTDDPLSLIDPLWPLKRL
uniref:Tyrosine-protein phosphatase non-receptor type 23 n=1 Tax=Timema poppense TaxID=170557 RepID=A0A7R9H418_TIMPO|nr:unnamed protein product [Timema poppensis]